MSAWIVISLVVFGTFLVLMLGACNMKAYAEEIAILQKAELEEKRNGREVR